MTAVPALTVKSSVIKHYKIKNKPASVEQFIYAYCNRYKHGIKAVAEYLDSSPHAVYQRYRFYVNKGIKLPKPGPTAAKKRLDVKYLNKLIAKELKASKGK